MFCALYNWLQTFFANNPTRCKLAMTRPLIEENTCRTRALLLCRSNCGNQYNVEDVNAYKLILLNDIRFLKRINDFYSNSYHLANDRCSLQIRFKPFIIIFLNLDK